jgi:hypothetical protein
MSALAEVKNTRRQIFHFLREALYFGNLEIASVHDCGTAGTCQGSNGMQLSKSQETLADPTPSSDNTLLSAYSIAVIEAALRKVSPFGEVHLIVERGHIRFVRTLKSEAIDHFKNTPSNAP